MDLVAYRWGRYACSSPSTKELHANAHGHSPRPITTVEILPWKSPELVRLKLPIGCLELPAHVTLADLTLTNRPGIAATNFLKKITSTASLFCSFVYFWRLFSSLWLYQFPQSGALIGKNCHLLFYRSQCCKNLNFSDILQNKFYNINYCSTAFPINIKLGRYWNYNSLIVETLRHPNLAFCWKGKLDLNPQP